MHRIIILVAICLLSCTTSKGVSPVSSRAYDIDINDGGALTLDGTNPLTVFGYDYETSRELFATTIRVRNTFCEGFSPCDYTNPPYNVRTSLTVENASGSILVLDIGHLQVRDNSLVLFRAGSSTVRSGQFEGFDQGGFIIQYDPADDPLFDGVVTIPGKQPSTPDTVHTLQWKNSRTGVTENITVLLHDASFVSLIGFVP